MGFKPTPVHSIARAGMFALAIAGTMAHAQQAPEAPADKLRGLDISERVEGSYIVVLDKTALRDEMRARGTSDRQHAVHTIAHDQAFRFGGRIEATWSHALEGFAISGIDDHAARRIAAQTGVAFVEANTIHKAGTVQSPATWGMDRIDQRHLPLDNSYTYSYTGSGVRAYIVDTGISAHSEFGSRLKTGFTAISDAYGTSDCNGHGTHVAGTVGGSTYGVAKGVDLYPVRVLGCGGTGTATDIINGLNWIKKSQPSPAIVNYSIGGPITSSIEISMADVVANGFTVVVAAGNYASDACLFTPARMAATTDIITVANSMNNDARNPDSNWGRCVTLFAPGTNIVSAGHAGGTLTMTGTSMSSPHVAGAAALYLEANPASSPATLKSAIVWSSTRGVISNTGSSPNRLLFTGFTSPGGSDPAFTPVPGAPSGLDSMCVNAGGLFDFFWNPSSGDVGTYELWQSSNHVLNTPWTSATVGVAGATTGWKVRACNGAGCSAYSNIHNVPWSPGQVCM